MQITTEAIKALRERTAAGIMDCKKALEQAGGVVEEAEKILFQQGLALASKKATRTAQEGLIETYIHGGGRLGAMIELNCETDFVARTEEFRTLAHDLAMQVAAMAPRYVSLEDVPENERVNSDEICLTEQTFIKDQSKAVKDVITETIAKVDENIRVKRFVRYVLGA